MRPLILVVEDEPSIQELIRFNLEQADYEVTTCDSGDLVIEAVQNRNPDLILLDIMLPGRSGLELCSDLQQPPISPSPPIILLTALSEEENIIRGLETGACDYITKPFSPGILLARVKNALRQTNRPSSASHDVEQIRVGALCIDLHQHKATLENQALSLTLTEFKILHLLAGQPGRVFTRYQIVDQVHGEDYAVTDRSIDVQIVNLRKKMAKHGAYIETVRGIGYRFTEE